MPTYIVGLTDLLYSGVVLSQYINAKVVSCGIILIIDFAIFWSSPQRIPSLVIINIIMNPPQISELIAL